MQITTRRENLLDLVREYQSTGSAEAAFRLQKALVKASNQEKDELKSYLQQNNIDLLNENNNKNLGGKMADDNNTVVSELDQKLKTIEDRLKQIEGYKFIPPSIKQEKESLNRQREVLLATKSRLESGGGAPPVDAAPKAETAGLEGLDDSPMSPFLQQSPIPSPAPNPVDNSQMPSFSAPQFKPEPPAEEKKESPREIKWPFSQPKRNDAEEQEKQISEDLRRLEEEEKKQPAVGTDFAYPRADELAKTEDDEESSKTSRDEDRGFEVKTNFQLITSLEDMAQRTEEVIKTCRETLNDTVDHADKDYLGQLVNEFSEVSKKLIEKASQTKMSEAWKVKATRGRLVTYLKALQADFEFSELFNSKIQKKIDNIIG